MFIINKRAVHLFKIGMSYAECAEAFKAAGFGDIPFGEYCLMLGAATYSEKNGIPSSIVFSGLNHYTKPDHIIHETASSGLGDTVAKITHATGLDKLATLYTSLSGKPCGCSSRQDALNKLFPYEVKEDGE